jgi:hypothetical protein
MPDDNKQRGSLGDLTKMSREELERKAAQLKREIAENQRAVAEKEKFIKEEMRKVIDDQPPEIKQGWRELEMEEALEKTERGRESSTVNVTYPEFDKKLDTLEQKTKKEIESLREKLLNMDKKKGDEEIKLPGAEVPTYQLGPSLPEDLKKFRKLNAPGVFPEEPKGIPERYAVAPAKDLGTSDFDWQGPVGGVEIEKKAPEEFGETGEEVTNQTKVLEEVEYPPSYGATSLEEKLAKLSEGEILEAPVSKVGEASRQDLDRKRGEAYKGEDPYREPIE